MEALNEAIQHAEHVALTSCGQCSADHIQLANWLTELRKLRIEVRNLNEDLINTLLQCRALADQEQAAIAERDAYQGALRELLDADRLVNEAQYTQRPGVILKARQIYTQAKGKALQLLAG